MPTSSVTDQNFATEVLGADKPVLVDFWAEWCGPCKRFGPIFEASSEANPEVLHAKVDTEAEQGLAGDLGITSIPTLMAFREGILVFNQAGALPAPALDQVLTAVKALDMAEVRAQIAAQDEVPQA